MTQNQFKRIALFGGSFNPPHWGHRQVVDTLRGLNQFDEVWVVPTFAHPFDKTLIAFHHRKTMCELTFGLFAPSVKICSIEEELKQVPSYTVDGVDALKKKFPDHQWTVVVGSDCRRQLDQWKDYQRLKNEVAFFFIPRPGFEDSPFMAISSSEIRKLISEGRVYSKYVTPEVARYIEENNLYDD